MPRKKAVTDNSRPPRPGERIYWNEDTERAVLEYNTSTDPEEREIIFRTRLDYPLDKMAENVINRFKFPYIKATFEDLKRQVVSHLLCNLHKFTKDKGRAFSYFSVIAKNYLILHNNNAWKDTKRSVSLSDSSGPESVINIEEVIQLEVPDTESQQDTSEFVRLMVSYWENNMHRFFKKKRDQDIAHAVLELFRRAEGIENFNKKNLYLLIREQTDCKTSYITKVVTKMREHIAEQLVEYHSHGTIGENEDKFFKYNETM
jgi:hypothetical protein